MTQETIVIKLSSAKAAELERKLAKERFDFRSVPYASFSARGEGVIMTHYTSGKLVVQGLGARAFVERYLAGEQESGSSASGAKASGAGASAPSEPLDQVVLVGSDECGKGDYFGPLIVAAVRLEPAQTKELRSSQVRDSKTMTDELCLRLGAALRTRYPHAIARLDPPRYNAIYKTGKLNELLADLHEQAIRELAQPGVSVLVDKFADEKLLKKRLADLDIKLMQRVRAEAVPAVAAASVIAREQFLGALKELSDEAAVHLRKGAGDPVDVAAREYVALHGRSELGKVAKLHFKNTLKLRL